jgi:hypothetical protein
MHEFERLGGALDFDSDKLLFVFGLDAGGAHRFVF